MYCVTKNYISETHELYSYCVASTKAAKLLYNASLFRIRNRFTGYKKDHLSSNEQEVLHEIELLQQSGRWNHDITSVLTYHALEKMMRVSQNPDFFCGTLSMQTAQGVVKQAVQDFKGWLSSLKSYAKQPDAFTGRPGMPHYIKTDRTTVCFTNQDCICRDNVVKFPLTAHILKIKAPDHGRLKEVKIKPYYNGFLILCTFECEQVTANTTMPYLAGIDFGVNSIAAVVTNEGHSLLFQGGAVKATNQYFHKEKARLTSAITKGHKDRKYATSRRIRNLSMRRDFFLRDQMHKISAQIVDFCLKHQIGILVFGINKNWKQGVHMNPSNVQAFASIPFAELQFMITYKAERHGILVVEQEESYTSKASFLDMDSIPVYGKETDASAFSGKRICRGLYQSKSGVQIHADLNGAANILRKAYPDAFASVVDFAYLQKPEVYGFHKLNPSCIPVTGIVAA